uniref:Maturase R n=1 Tax=Solanum tuberosum TaxID=4113 RepID=M1CQ11_SOLTU
MAERRWKAVTWIRCFTRRRFSSSRKNCIKVSLGMDFPSDRTEEFYRTPCSYGC